MSHTNITAEQAHHLSVLVNPNGIRSTIKRLFHNQIHQVLAELFQNSQRAGATKVDITTGVDSFTIHDNGHGLLDGVEGFHTLLKLADSRFDCETINDQDPMGVGIVSLLTHDQVNHVTFASGSLELTIDTKRWWEDVDYYSVWYERLRTIETNVAGLRIVVTCEPALIENVHAALQPKDGASYPFNPDASAAQGYEGILSITLNSESVRTSLPAWTRLEDDLISTTYLGSKLRIGYNRSRRASTILWYGQLIPLSASCDSFHFHLEVVSGRPVNPLSPTRAGLIQDTAYHQLRQFINDEIFKFVFDKKNRSKIKPEHVDACYQIDNARTTSECPYIIAEEITTPEHPNSLDEFQGTADLHAPDRRTLFLYDEAPLLINNGVTIQLPDSITDAYYGLHSFLAQLGPAYALHRGDTTRLNLGSLWWKPEGDPQHEIFYRPGQYAISYDDTAPTTWLPVTTGPVFAFNLPSSYEALQVDFTVGTTDIMAFIRNQAWAAFNPNDDESYSAQEQFYGESIDYWIRSLIGNCIPHDFHIGDITPFLKEGSAPILSVHFHYRQEGRLVNPKQLYKPDQPGNGLWTPSEITVVTAAPERVRLKLY